MDRHRASATIVEPFGSAWKNHLDEIVLVLDQQKIAPSLAWKAKQTKPQTHSWDRAAEKYPDRVIKAIERSITAVFGQNSGQKTPGTPGNSGNP
jgi:hypothetical protein